MKRKRLIGGAALALCLVALIWQLHSTRYLLKHSDQFVLYSILPYPYDQSGPDDERFHQRPVLGKVVIKDSSERTALVDALLSSFTANDLQAGCFTPRHGIHAVKNGRVIDMVICFECQGVKIYRDGIALSFQPITSDAKELFNQTLHKHNLPLATK